MKTKFDLGSFYIEITENEFQRLKPGEKSKRSSLLSSSFKLTALDRIKRKSLLSVVDMPEVIHVEFLPKGTNLSTFQILDVHISHASYAKLEQKGSVYLPYGIGADMEIKRQDYRRPSNNGMI